MQDFKEIVKRFDEEAASGRHDKYQGHDTKNYWSSSLAPFELTSLGGRIRVVLYFKYFSKLILSLLQLNVKLDFLIIESHSLCLINIGYNLLYELISYWNGWKVKQK